jgi:hypothetical protein
LLNVAAQVAIVIDAEIKIVAHSHGGNVAAKALANVKTLAVGLACLSTPFLRVRMRKAGAWSAKLIVVSLLFFLFQTVSIMVPGVQTFSRFGRRHHEMVGFIGAYVMLAAWKLYKYLQPRISSCLKRAAVRFSDSVNFRLRPGTAFLIIRMSDDEPGMALSTYRFFDWILETYLASVRRAWVILKMSFETRTGLKYKGLIASRWPKVSVLGNVIVFAAFLLWLYRVYRGSDHPFADVASVFYVVFLAVVCSLTAVLCLTAAFAVVPLGWGAVLGIFTETVSVDWTPPGAWKLNLVEPSSGASGLRHSQPYDNQQCLALLGSWMAQTSTE